MKPKVKLRNYKDIDRTAEGRNINSQNQRPHLSSPAVIVQVEKKYIPTFRRNHQKQHRLLCGATKTALVSGNTETSDVL